MSSSHPRVILYRYDGSPYCRKIENVLALKQIPYSTVTVLNMLPRPEITDLLGIKYRQIPILAIGGDVYCDTSIIVPALERRFPASKGYGTVFPSSEDGRWTDTGMIKAFAKFYAEGAIFAHVLGLLPWTTRFPEALVKDRGELRGAPIDVEKFAQYAPVAVSSLSTHISLVEEQLADGRAYLFPTRGISLADISVHFILDWARMLPGGEPLFDDAPATKKWINRINEEIDALRKKLPDPPLLSGADAAEAIKSAEYEPYVQVGFDTTEAGRLGVHEGMDVKVTHDEIGRDYPTFGKLVSLSKHEITIEVKPQGAEDERVVRVHFPRLSFNVRAPDAVGDIASFRIV